MSATDGIAKHVLLLAGSGEARLIAARLAGRQGVKVTASLLHEPRRDELFAVPVRIGGFGGAEAFEAYLKQEKIAAVLDATHPFAVRIGARSALSCARLGLPFVRVLRDAWLPEPGDTWREVPDEAAVGAVLRSGQRVFATTGRATLERLALGSGAQFLVRQKSERCPPAHLGNVSYVTGSGPFSVAQEAATLRRLQIDVLVAKNSGGTASRTKLDAARALGLPVILIGRPPQPHAPILNTVDAALDWVDRVLASDG